MAALDLFPSRVRFVDANGVLTAEGYRALNALYARVGGATGPSTPDLALSEDDDSGLEEFKAEFTKALEGLQMPPVSELVPFVDPLHPLPQEHPAIEHLQSEVAALREQVAVLMQQINDLQQGELL